MDVGVAHVTLFPDTAATNDYVTWYDRASEDGGDGGYLSAPVLRVCNAVVTNGGGVSSPEARVSDAKLA